MTEILYPVDTESAYVRTFSARVVALPPGAVVLDRTYFYPGGGGQPPDRGELVAPGGERVPVVDVARTGTQVLHRLGRGSGGRAHALRPDDAVDGRIDWDRRYAHMRLHTGQHLASAILFREYGLRTRKAVLGRDRATIDLESSSPDREALDRFHEAFGEAVRAGRPVHVSHVERGEYERSPSARSGLVPLPTGISTVRLIEIEGLDAAPCGGTHLRSTGEIGEVLWESTGSGAPERLAFTLGPRRGPPTIPVG